MRTMNLFFGFLVLLASHAASAKADPACVKCASFERLSVKLRNNTPDALDDATVAVGPLATGRTKTLSPAEAEAFVDLALLMLKEDQKENGGDAASQLFGVWKRHQDVMDQAVSKRSADEQSYLRAERRRGQRLMSQGNG